MSGEEWTVLGRLRLDERWARDRRHRTALVLTEDLTLVLAEVERLRTIVASLVESEVDP